MAKKRQLLIVQPSLVAMVYALNSKPGCFTGFCQVKTPGHIFDILDFLAAQALPGPYSFVTCIVQHYGLSGPAQFFGDGEEDSHRTDSEPHIR